MSETYKAATGISYLSGGEWRVVAAGDDVEMDEKQAKVALSRGIITASGKAAPQQKEEVTRGNV
jgi:hypothetical protein